jgi:hypothetical protein
MRGRLVHHEQTVGARPVSPTGAGRPIDSDGRGLSAVARALAWQAGRRTGWVPVADPRADRPDPDFSAVLPARQASHGVRTVHSGPPRRNRRKPRRFRAAALRDRGAGADHPTDGRRDLHLGPRASEHACDDGAVRRDGTGTRQRDSRHAGRTSTDQGRPRSGGQRCPLCARGRE